MLRTWSGRGSACGLMRVNCAVLLLVAQYQISKAQAGTKEEVVVQVAPAPSAAPAMARQTAGPLSATQSPGSMALQNDSVTDGSEVGYFSAFRAGDIPAAVFDFPSEYDAFKIESVQILWALNDAGFDSFVDVHLYQGGLPSPVKLATIPEVPVQPGIFTEIRPDIEKGQDGTLPAQSWVVYKAGGSFAIGVEYLTTWTDADGPFGTIDDISGHQALDTDGCQRGKNMFYSAANDLWVDPADYDVPGDFVIRVTGKGFVSKAPFGDKDRDVDQNDFGAFQACFDPLGTVAPGCDYFDFGVEQGDGKIDTADYDAFAACYSGPMIPADPQCGSCLPVPVMRTQGSSFAIPPGSRLGNGPALWLPFSGWVTAVILIALLALGFLVWYLWTAHNRNLYNWFVGSGTCPPSAGKPWEGPGLLATINAFGPGGWWEYTSAPSIAYPVVGSWDADANAAYLLLVQMYDPGNPYPPPCRIQVVPHSIGQSTGIMATTLLGPTSGSDLIYIDGYYFPGWNTSTQATIMLYAEGTICGD